MTRAQLVQGVEAGTSYDMACDMLPMDLRQPAGTEGQSNGTYPCEPTVTATGSIPPIPMDEKQDKEEQAKASEAARRQRVLDAARAEQAGWDLSLQEPLVKLEGARFVVLPPFAFRLGAATHIAAADTAVPERQTPRG